GLTGAGIIASFGSKVQNCSAFGNKGDGIRAISECSIVGNVCSENGNGIGAGDGAGVHVTGADNRIEENNVIGNDRGIDVDAGGNLVLKNSASGNGTNYDISIASSYGPIVDVTAGGAITTTSPW